MFHGPVDFSYKKKLMAYFLMPMKVWLNLFGNPTKADSPKKILGKRQIGSGAKERDDLSDIERISKSQRLNSGQR